MLVLGQRIYRCSRVLDERLKKIRYTRINDSTGQTPRGKHRRCG